MVIAVTAWQVRHGAPYKSGTGFGYALGLVGGLMMLMMLLYPLRKRVQFMREWGALKYWFRIHMILGIFGPLFAVFHSTLHVGSFNAGVALSSMLLVVVSGIVGRFIYRRIHHELYGSRATLQELQQTMMKELEALDPLLRRVPLVKRELDAFAALVSRKVEGRWRRVAHFMSLGWRRSLVEHRVQRAIRSYVARDTGGGASHADLTSLLRTIDVTLQAVQRTAQFSTYERLFSLLACRSYSFHVHAGHHSRRPCRGCSRLLGVSSRQQFAVTCVILTAYVSYASAQSLESAIMPGEVIQGHAK